MVKLLSVADLITLLNAVLGFLSLLTAFSGQLQLAASLIFLGLLADGLDGIVARRLGNGRIGEFLEPMADLISLSVAPLVLFYMVYDDVLTSQLSLHVLVGGVLVFSLLCSIIRLSSFSLLKEKSFFVGLPTSASALFLVVLVFLRPTIWYVIPVLLLLSLAMISSIRFPKPGLKVNLVTTTFIVTTIVLDGNYYSIAPLLLLGALAVYIFFGPVYLHFKKEKITGTAKTRN
jgi:archaetidylserine synthase